MNQELERINKLIDTAFEHLSPMDYDEVITCLQKENFALKKKCNTGEINVAYAATIERQDIERQKQAVKINKLSQKNEKQQKQSNYFEKSYLTVLQEINVLHSEIIELQERLRKADEVNKNLLSTLKLVKISMELSEEPFYKGMKVLNKALQDYKESE